jgi:anti-sigma28 factor (negative regulator of flagellin synthesis)
MQAEFVGAKPMSQINGVGSNSPVQKIVNQPIQKQVPAEAPKQLPLTDRVELSGVGGMLKALKQNDIRADKVAQVKAAIEAGTYESEDKIDIAADRLLDDLMR